jgi:hypothetical protein
MTRGDSAWMAVAATLAAGVLASCDDDNGSTSSGTTAGTGGSGGSAGGAGRDSSAGTSGAGMTADSGEPHDAAVEISVLGDASNDSDAPLDGDPGDNEVDAAPVVCGSGRTFEKMAAGTPRALASRLFSPDRLRFDGSALLFSSTQRNYLYCTVGPTGCVQRSFDSVRRVDLATGSASLVAAGSDQVNFDVEGSNTFVVAHSFFDEPPKAWAARYGADGAAGRTPEWEGRTGAIRAAGGSVFYFRSDFRCLGWASPSFPRRFCYLRDERHYLVETPIDRFDDMTALRRLADTFVVDVVSDGHEVVFASQDAVRSVTAGSGVAYDADAGADAGPEPPPSRELLSGLKGVGGLALDSDAIYVATHAFSDDAGVTSGRLVRIDRSDGSVHDLVSTGAPRSLALDAQHVYFVDGPSECGLVARVPKRGGPVELVAVDQPYVSSVVVTSNLVAWTHWIGGELWMPDIYEKNPRGAILVADK